MPKAAQDPVVKVVRYFEQADLGSAITALNIAKEIVGRRKSQQADLDIALRKGPAAIASPKKKRKKPAGPVAVPAAARKEEDVPLPGMAPALT